MCVPQATFRVELTKHLDRFGRRPVVLAGVGGLAITTLLFGLSSSFPAALLARAAGVFYSANLLYGALLSMVPI